MFLKDEEISKIMKETTIGKQLSYQYHPLTVNVPSRNNIKIPMASNRHIEKIRAQNIKPEGTLLKICDPHSNRYKKYLQKQIELMRQNPSHNYPSNTSRQQVHINRYNHIKQQPHNQLVNASIVNEQPAIGPSYQQPLQNRYHTSISSSKLLSSSVTNTANQKLLVKQNMPLKRRRIDEMVVNPDEPLVKRQHMITGQHIYPRNQERKVDCGCQACVSLEMNKFINNKQQYNSSVFATNRNPSAILSQQIKLEQYFRFLTKSQMQHTAAKINHNNVNMVHQDLRNQFLPAGNPTVHKNHAFNSQVLQKQYLHLKDLQHQNLNARNHFNYYQANLETKMKHQQQLEYQKLLGQSPYHFKWLHSNVQPPTVQYKSSECSNGSVSSSTGSYNDEQSCSTGHQNYELSSRPVITRTNQLSTSGTMIKSALCIGA